MRAAACVASYATPRRARADYSLFNLYLARHALLALGLELGLCDAREMHLVGAVGEP